MKSHLLAGLLVAAASTQVLAQPGYYYQFQGSQPDRFAAATRILNHTYYAVGNTRSGTSVNNRILLCKMTDAGALLWSRAIEIPESLGVCHASDIQAGYSSFTPSENTPAPGDKDPYPASFIRWIPEQNTHDYLYISGTVTNTQGRKSMLVLKVNANGAVLWARHNFNPANSDISEEGVSVESAPNGDVFVVGSSLYQQQNLAAVAVARLDNAGNLLWCNRYVNPQDPAGNFVPRQSCLFQEYEGATPARPDPPIAIAITGAYYGYNVHPLLTNAFVMRVSHGGLESWRGIYPSGVMEGGEVLYDEGNDIVVDQEDVWDVDFTITGGMHTKTETMRHLYPFRVDDAGGFVAGFKVTPFAGTNAGTMIGTSLVKTAYTVALHAGIFKDASDSLHVFLAAMDPKLGGISWSRQYDYVQPFAGKPRLVNEDYYDPARGHLIATASNASGSALDAALIRTDRTGLVNDACPPTDLALASEPVGSGMLLSYQRQPSTAVQPLTMGWPTLKAPDFLCRWTGRREASTTGMTLSEHNAPAPVSLYPNPASPARRATLSFSLTSAQEVSIELTTPDGRTVWSHTGTRSAGTHQVAITTSGLPGGLYFVRFSHSGDRNVLPLLLQD